MAKWLHSIAIETIRYFTIRSMTSNSRMLNGCWKKSNRWHTHARVRFQNRFHDCKMVLLMLKFALEERIIFSYATVLLLQTPPPPLLLLPLLMTMLLMSAQKFFRLWSIKCERELEQPRFYYIRLIMVKGVSNMHTHITHIASFTFDSFPFSFVSPLHW